MKKNEQKLFDKANAAIRTYIKDRSFKLGDHIIWGDLNEIHETVASEVKTLEEAKWVLMITQFATFIESRGIIITSKKNLHDERRKIGWMQEAKLTLDGTKMIKTEFEKDLQEIILEDDNAS